MARFLTQDLFQTMFNWAFQHHVWPGRHISLCYAFYFIQHSSILPSRPHPETTSFSLPITTTPGILGKPASSTVFP
jgi:hypothetical protein